MATLIKILTVQFAISTHGYKIKSKMEWILTKMCYEYVHVHKRIL